MASTRTSRDPSRAQLASPSRTPSRLDAKARPYSAGPNSSPGLSSNSRRLTASTRYLELRLVEVTAAGKREPWLTERDAAILQALDSYRYLDRRQIQALFFEGPRSSQYRLKWLVDPRLGPCLGGGHPAWPRAQRLDLPTHGPRRQDPRPTSRRRPAPLHPPSRACAGAASPHHP